MSDGLAIALTCVCIVVFGIALIGFVFWRANRSYARGIRAFKQMSKEHPEATAQWLESRGDDEAADMLRRGDTKGLDE